MTKEYIDVANQILQWYKKEGRDLPWRRTRNPYRILVSEIMLQQTQVDRVITKYREFLKAFPSAKALAEAKTSDVIKEWAGLGYNRRALFLQRTAQAVRSEYSGRFPKNLEALKKLPGVGDYTARAILSFAFEEPVPMMDTNHRKFYTRLFFKGKNTPDADLLHKAQKLVDTLEQKRGVFHKKKLGTWSYHWNQALMDFMTAVARNNEHPLVQTFIQTYPERQKAKKKKKTIPFKQTDRYFRGRIIDRLREEHKASLASLKTSFPQIDQDRFNAIISKLESDHLIKRQKQSIMLP